MRLNSRYAAADSSGARPPSLPAHEVEKTPCVLLLLTKGGALVRICLEPGTPAKNRISAMEIRVRRPSDQACSHTVLKFALMSNDG